ncbi:MAG: VWA domain-containing protein [Longicatena sp.]
MKKKIAKALLSVLSGIMVISLFLCTTPGKQLLATPSNDGETNDDKVNASVPLTQAGPMISRASASTEGLKMSKTAKAEGDDRYSINLEAYVEGSVTSTAVPSDIVLVLDQSGSMGDDFVEYKKIFGNKVNTDKSYYILIDNEYKKVEYCDNRKHLAWEFDGKNYDDGHFFPKTSESDTIQNHVQFYYKASGEQKMTALKKAVTGFVTSVADNATKNNVDHRVAMVGFSSKDNNKLFKKSGDVIYNTLQYYPDSYKGAYYSVKNSGEASALEANIGYLWPLGATNTDKGIEMANGVLEYNARQDANKVVIVFTDGEPNNHDGFDEPVANNAIEQAGIAKATHKATVYSVGVVQDADPTAPINPNTYSDSRYTSGQKINKFLQYVSSNFNQNDLTMDSSYTTVQSAGHYLVATNSDELNNIFGSISDSITPSVILGKNTILKDVVSAYFKKDGSTNVSVYTADYTGKNADGKINWTAETPTKEVNATWTTNDTLQVTGFDYSANCIHEAAGSTPVSGKKLIVKITGLTRSDGFIGGNSVPTNTADSGVSVNEPTGSIDKKFEQPNVDVPLKYEMNVQNQSIYLGNQLNDAKKFFTDANADYLIDNTGYKWNEIHNKFVTITYTLKDGNKEIGTYTVNPGATSGSWVSGPTTDTTGFTETHMYTVDVKVTPTEPKTTNPELAANKDANLYIYKPTLVASDETVFLGDTTDLNNRVGKPTWKSDVTTAPTPDSAEPTLSLTHNSKNGTEQGNDITKYAPTVDSDIKLIVKNGEIDITNNSTITNADGKDASHDYTIYVIRGQLNIVKNINDQYTTATAPKANQSFIFKIEKRDSKDGNVVDTFYQTIDFSANQKDTEKQVLVKGLKKGYYTVSEMTDWSWKYAEQSNLRKDNYNKNASENVNLFIGDRDSNKEYYGTETNPATTLFVNNLRTDINILGDGASAINKFTGINKGLNIKKINSRFGNIDTVLKGNTTEIQESKR